MVICYVAIENWFRGLVFVILMPSEVPECLEEEEEEEEEQEEDPQ